ncbi:8089_t:CDS:1, partial [Scutellospora calospora]
MFIIFIIQKSSIEIIVNSLKSAIIQNLIKEKYLREDLLEVYERLKKKKVI